MQHGKLRAGLLILAAAFTAAACQDPSPPTVPADPDRSAADVPTATAAFQEQELAAWFDASAPEVLALPGTVYADHDEAEGRLVFGVESESAVAGVKKALAALEIPSSAYRVVVTEPIRFLATTLQSKHRPTVAGIQIHFSNYVCTLGFNADHGGGRSFVTNSHCTEKQGDVDGTAYYQPSSGVDPTPIAFEVDDPAYFKGGDCPRGRKCRYSDAARALYESGIENDGEIAKTTGVNNGEIDVTGVLDVAARDGSTTQFTAGASLDKIGRTTGWTRGDVEWTCADVNVIGSNITLLCQTGVQKDDTELVAGGDSGSPVFRATTADAAELVGLLWGGSTSGDLFVFSPLKNIQDELGSLDATTDGVGSGDGGGGGGGDDDGGGGNCPPGNPDHKNCA